MGKRCWLTLGILGAVGCGGETTGRASSVPDAGGETGTAGTPGAGGVPPDNGTGGSGALVDAGGTGGSAGNDGGPTCTPGQSQCDGPNLQTCDSSGQWQSGATCPFVCIAGACSGTCVPGEKECSGTGTQTCDNLGQWAGSGVCPSPPNGNPTCSGQGICGFTCQQGFVDCNGDTADGCETQLGTTSACLACADTCTAPAQATPTCTAAGCGFACSGLWADCNGNPADGCEQDVSSDSKNCGGCGVKCHGNACISGQCQYTVEQIHAAKPEYIRSLTGDANNLYWAFGPRLYKLSKASQVSQVLADVAGFSGGSVATNGVDVFWSSFLDSPTEQIRKVSINGGASTQMSATWGPRKLATDGDHIYWRDQQPCPVAGTGCTSPDDRVFRMPVGGGSPTLMDSFTAFWNGDDLPFMHAENGSAVVPVYFHYDAAIGYLGRIYRVWEGGHSVAASCGTYPGTPGCHEFELVGSLTANATHLFFMARVRTPAHAVVSLYRVHKLGPSQAEWIGSYTPHFYSNTSLAADGSHVYLARGGFIGRFPVNSGPLEIISTGQWGGFDIVIDATHVYWRVHGFNPPDYTEWQEASIMRTTKPP